MPAARSNCREEEWRRVLATDLDAVFFWAQEAARRMLAAEKKGAIVNIASVLGIGVDKGVVAYATAKAGVIQMTKALGLELAFKGVRVNAIAPGWFVTELNSDYLTSQAGAAKTREIPVGRFGEDGDLDGPLLLLVSDAGAYMAGTTIVVDGGQVVCMTPRVRMNGINGFHFSRRRSSRTSSPPARAPSSPTMCCRSNPIRRISTRTRTSASTRSGRCRRRPRPPACGRRRRRRIMAAWAFRRRLGGDV